MSYIRTFKVHLYNGMLLKLKNGLVGLSEVKQAQCALNSFIKSRLIGKSHYVDQV